jgi:hypothetical protein
MAKAYSQDLRDGVIDAVKGGKLSRRAAGRHYEVSESAAIKWLERLERYSSSRSRSPWAPPIASRNIAAPAVARSRGSRPDGEPALASVTVWASDLLRADMSRDSRPALRAMFVSHVLPNTLLGKRVKADGDISLCSNREILASRRGLEPLTPG